jgi:pimeloyl-ACP methyl ester carboxylesterase
VPKVTANAIQIEYDTFGSPTSAPLLLITGLGGQLILWEESFCEQLAENGLYVIRFDNRDSGLSSKCGSRKSVDFEKIARDIRQGKQLSVPYTLEDMAADAIGLLDGLEIEQAHICGASMGGMIAQLMAILYPSRIKSLISISSTTSDPQVAAELLSPANERQSIPFLTVPIEREKNIEYTVEGFRALSGPGFVFDQQQARTMAERLYDRCFCPDGANRQLLAILVASSRKPQLAKLSIPFLVIHGDRDPLIPLAHGIDTFESVLNARLLVIEGMGHDLPRATWPRVIQAIVDHTKVSDRDMWRG